MSTKTKKKVKRVSKVSPVSSGLAVKRAAAKMDDAVTSAEQRIEAFERALEEIGDKGEIKQGHMQCRLSLTRLRDALDDGIETFKRTAVRVKDGGGSFEVGRISVRVVETERKSVSWKSEAVALAEKLAEVSGKAFDEKTYLAETADLYEPSKSRSVKLLESD